MEQTLPEPPNEKSLPAESIQDPSPPAIPQSTEVPQTPVETQIETHNQEPQPPSCTEPHSTTTTNITSTSPPSIPPPTPTTTTATATATAATTTTTTTTSLTPTPSSITSTSSVLQPSTTTSTPSLPSIPNHTPQSIQNIQPRPSTPTQSAFGRPWQQQQSSPFNQFSLPSSPTPPLPSSTSSAPSLPSSASQLPVQRGGIVALGVPAHHPASLPPPTSAFNNPPFGLGRNVPDSTPSSSNSQVRQPIQVVGSLGASSTMRPTGVLGHHMRPMQSSAGPPSGLNMQSLTTQTFQGHGMLRGQSLLPSGSSGANTGQNLQPQNQPWLSSTAQVKSPLPPPSIRPQMNPQSLQQRPHIPQQKQQTISTTTQQQAPSQVKQFSNTSQPPEQLPQQYPPPRAQTPVAPQQQIGKNHGMGIQRSSSLGGMQAGANHSGPPGKTSIEETEDTCSRILSKRTIHELVNQIDSSEKLDPEVEDILVDIAEDFVESITTFGCSLAKHRKSTVLEAKDILLHVERNWNMTLPGFGGDEIKIYKKPLTNDLHKERLAVIKKSIIASESTNAKSFAGQAAGSNPKSHSAKGPANVLGSPNT